MKIKIISLLMALIMVIGMLASCGGDGDGTGGTGAGQNFDRVGSVAALRHTDDKLVFEARGAVIDGVDRRSGQRNRQAKLRFDQVFGKKAGVVRGAAGSDRNAGDLLFLRSANNVGDDGRIGGFGSTGK